MRTSARGIVLATALVATATLARPCGAATSGANGTHDPSRMVESNGKFWVFSTGGGSKSSTDGLVWSDGPRLFASGKPTWLAAAVPNDQGLWAPDAIHYNGQYYVFYSYANKACALGVVTSPTLDTTSPAFKWTDRGMVVSNTSTASYCVIDPAPVVDADNNLWVAWGSGYSHKDTDDTIFVTRLDNATGLASTTDTTKPGYPLVKGHVEGSYMYYHAGYYYLWWNSGGCCSGASSTYTIHVARSPKITGPFTDARIFYSSTGSVHGPGHLGIYTGCGVERMTYHYYPDTGGSVLGENELTWGDDGWPKVGAPSSTPIKACSDEGTSGTPSGGGAGSGGSNATGGNAMIGAGNSAGSDANAGSATGGVTSSPETSAGGSSASAGTAASVAGTSPAATTAGSGSLDSNAAASSDDASSCSISRSLGANPGRCEGLLLAGLGVLLASARRVRGGSRKSARRGTPMTHSRPELPL